MGILLNDIKINLQEMLFFFYRVAAWWFTVNAHISSLKVPVQTLRPKNHTSWLEILNSRCECVSEWWERPWLKNNMDRLTSDLYLEKIIEKLKFYFTVKHVKMIYECFQNQDWWFFATVFLEHFGLHNICLCISVGGPHHEAINLL